MKTAAVWCCCRNSEFYVRFQYQPNLCRHMETDTHGNQLNFISITNQRS